MSSKGSKGSKGSKKESSPRGATRRSALKRSPRTGDSTRRAHIDLGRNTETLIKEKLTDAEIAQLWQTGHEFGFAKRDSDREKKLAQGELGVKRSKALKRHTITQHRESVIPEANKEVTARLKVIKDAARKGMSRQLRQDIAHEAANRAATGPSLRSHLLPRRSRINSPRQDGFIMLRRQQPIITDEAREREQPRRARSMFRSAIDFLTYPFTRRRGGKVHRNTRKNKKSKTRK